MQKHTNANTNRDSARVGRRSTEKSKKRKSARAKQQRQRRKKLF